MTKGQPDQSEEHVSRKMHKKLNKRQIPVIKLLFFIITLSLGYLLGAYRYQIEAAIGPVFGHKVYSGALDLSSLQRTYAKLASNFDGTLDTDLLIQGANRGLVEAAGDDYTVYMSSKESTEFNDSLSGNVGSGIGAEIGIKNDKIVVVRTLANNPAVKVGLLAGDVILSVNDESTDGWTVSEAVSAIKGDEGTTVKLNIQRGDSTKEYVITRAVINNPSVESSISNGVGILTITRFDSETGNLAKAAAQNFKNQGVKAVILDLRGNGGGYVNAGIDVASLWLNDKIVVTERSGDVTKDTLKSGKDAILSGISTIVLVDGSSASASEIVAGALQDYGVAKLVGVKTFGKGSVQQLFGFDDGSQLKVTVARWYTPNGKNITKEGITPDSVVNISQQDIDNSVDSQLDEAKKLLGL
ncbi:MAG: carboxyl-terminal processing protease [Patescibacteria group bacterium]|nr:carboxyl-terminal processing protease [Patescibacteria group bacterium]